MIQSVLGELVPAGETLDAPGPAAGEEEEGSSSTPDAEDGKATGVVQIFDSPTKPPVAPVVASSPLELVQVPSQAEVTMLIEEKASGGHARGSEELGAEEEARIASAPEVRVPAFVQSLNYSSPYYERLRKKRAFTSNAALLSCEGHPYVPALPEIMKAFYDELLVTEGDIFQNCSVAWPAFRSIIINGLFDSVRKLEKHMIMDVPTTTLEEVAEVAALAAQNGVRVDWLDEALGRVAMKKKHQELLDRIQTLEDELAELDRRRDEVSQLLSEADAELVYNNFSHQRVTNFRTRVLRRGE